MMLLQTQQAAAQAAGAEELPADGMLSEPTKATLRALIEG